MDDEQEVRQAHLWHLFNPVTPLHAYVHLPVVFSPVEAHFI